jgi:hypothetical protein
LDIEKGASNTSDEISKKYQKGSFRNLIIGALIVASVGVNCYFAFGQSKPT